MPVNQNQRINSYIVLDLAKPTPTAIDLSSNFNGRVGDSQSYLKLWLKAYGLPQNLTSKTLFFAGIDPAAQPKKIYGTTATDHPGDDIQAGRITFYFPGNTFQAEGDWDPDNTYFGVADADGNTISTINVALHVLSNSVEMQVASKPFYTQLEKVTADGKQKVQAWVDQAQAKLKEITTQVNAALDDVLDPKSSLNVTIKALKKQLDALQTQLDKNDFVSLTDFTTLKTKFDALQADLAQHKYGVYQLDLSGVSSSDFPRFSAYLYQYGAGIPQPDPGYFGVKSTHELPVQAEFTDGNASVAFLINQAQVKKYLDDFNPDQLITTYSSDKHWLYLTSGVSTVGIQTTNAKFK
ncbi:BppU family phage baseplate upper protein [Loigolactobacillus rennini]|uniref:BppU N-terminal domain-containing protein n=1 Tax=Loigolactobacillus rennini DSM 20253 TaxID=1423796 RepID=A0A0R2CT08_9LACO|nr:BppU family phage baseplate upper protein [Loigolactobacillus rennini]KRM92788.1 hypothetical protein FC24_GL000957 [Loigolactobacillus rennini DSM 20253]